MKLQELIAKFGKGVSFTDFIENFIAQDSEIKVILNSIKLRSTAKIYSYRLAISEANHNWLYGRDSLGYQVKY